MAPDWVADVLVMDLELQDGGLDCHVEKYEAPSGERLIVSWSRRNPVGYSPIGGGVAHVKDTPPRTDSH
jgi:hypothetical protein